MSDCEFIDGCPFFSDQLENMPAVSGLLKKQYCQGEFEACARFRVAAKVGSTNVPANLFPQDTTAADRIVAGT